MRKLDAKTAFEMGRAFALGLYYGRKMRRLTQDDEKVQFRTLKNGNKIAIKDGKVAGGAGSSVGPDKLPTYEWFAKDNPDVEGASFTKGVTKYLKHLIAQRGSPEVKCNGSYNGKPIVATFTSSSIDEIASKTSQEGRSVLPYVFNVLETGTLLGIVPAPKESHKLKGIQSFAYFRKTIDIGGEEKVVQVDVALMRPSEKPPAKPYVVGIKEKAPTFNTPLVGGGHSADALAVRTKVPPRETNIAKDSSPFKAIPVGIRIVK